MAKKQPPLIPLSDIQTALNPEAAPLLSATLEDVTGGPRAVAEVEAAQRVAAAPLQAAQSEAEASHIDLVKAAATESYTGYIVEAIQRNYDAQFADYDPTFDATRRAGELLPELGLQVNEDNLKVLALAGNEEDMVRLATGLQKHRESEQLLAENGFYALASGMLDPIELMAGMATFGASKSLQLGRLASATLGAGTATAVTGAADVAGKDISGSEYLINAGINAGVFALFGGRGAPSWTGNANVPDNPGKVRKWLNSQLSEFDKLAKVNPDTERLMSTIMDDPVRRAATTVNANSASLMRRYRNEADGLVKEYEDALDQAIQQQGYGWVSRRYDPTGKAGGVRDDIQRQVATELLRRDEQWRVFGNVMPDDTVPPVVNRLADLSDKLHGRLGELARDAGVRGFEDFRPHPGYFHRSWNDTFIRAIDSKHPGAARKLIAASALSGIKGLEREEADALAGALIRRVADKASGMRSDFMGGLGQADTAYLREALENAKVKPGVLDSIMAKVEQKASDQGTVKYGKHRLTFDMSASLRMPDGTMYRMSDLIDTDLDRVMENYVQGITGRAALARQGLGDDAAINAFKRDYLNSIKDLPQTQQDDLMLQLDGLLSDFTGMRPEANILGQQAQRIKSVADATMLSASGFWQVGEYATMAQRHGVAETAKQFMAQFPGVKQALKKINGDPDLADELSTVLNLDLARDVRIRPWKRQHDAFLASQDTAFDRFLHMGKQVVPYLNGMKYVHSHQARMNANLVLNKFARAAKGDADALAQIKSYAPDLDWPAVQAAIQRNVTYGSGKNASSFNWSAWGQGEIDQIMNTALRMMDDSLLFGRAGQGAAFGRSAVGQVMFQFRSFVAFAHNKLLRGTLHNQGAGGLATLLAYQYPVTFLAVSANEARKGQLDLSEKGVRNLAVSAVSYTAGLGFVADAANIIGVPGLLGAEGRPGFSIPMLSLIEAPARMLGGIKDVVQGDTREGVHDIGKAATMVVPHLNVMPGTALLLDAVKGE